jgi:hypothetical protein
VGSTAVHKAAPARAPHLRVENADATPALS